ncbi:MAG: type II CAAX endopeptidase family protein [Ginsengibacter sp.]
MENELRPFWNKFFGFNWKLGLFLIIIVCIPRFILVLNANASGNYSSIGLIMAISAIAPFIFLTKYGRKKIGITNPKKKWSWLLIAFITGLAVSILLYFLGQSMYGNSYDNWYNYIGRSYNIPQAMDHHDKAVLFTIMAITAMTFSPIGEELFFRGIVHSSFAKSIGEKKASIVDSSAFAATHISHFGLVFINNRWNFLTTPALIWVSSMFLVSVLFFVCKRYAGSILGAIVCHSAFNLGMVYCIFYHYCPAKNSIKTHTTQC